MNYEQTKELLEEYGWELDCWGPLEISSTENGRINRATGEAAQIIINMCQERAKQEAAYLHSEQYITKPEPKIPTVTFTFPVVPGITYSVIPIEQQLPSPKIPKTPKLAESTGPTMITNVIGVSDQDGNETLYVDGERFPHQRENTISIEELAEVIQGRVIRFTHVVARLPPETDSWPRDFGDLLSQSQKFVEEETKK